MISINKLTKLTTNVTKTILNGKFNRNFSLQTKNFNQSKPLSLSFNSCDSNDNGNRPPVIIMHGLFGSKQNWKSLCKAMNLKTNPNRTIIAVDARNHGESPHANDHGYDVMADDVADFMKQQGLSKASLIGHSMGGRTMMYVALKYVRILKS